MNSVHPFSLKRKVILITGANSGIGRQCAISCANAGADLILVGRNRERMDETVQQLNNETTCRQYLLDLTNEESVEDFVLKLKSEGTLINGAIHAAGISTTLPIRLSTFSKQEEILRVNVQAPINLTRLLIKKGGGLVDRGSIIFITSVMATVGEVGKSLYGMSKGALLAASKSMAIELAPRKIRVNSISPGVIKTPMSKASPYSQDQIKFKEMEKLHPLGVGKPEDVANGCIYLLSDETNWVTGTNLTIDGGYTSK